MEQPQIRLVHWYHTDTHRIACGAPGQSNSTKHARGVTCRACLALLADARAAQHVPAEPASYV